GDEAAYGVRHAELLEGQELARDAPQHQADVAALLEDGDAETIAVGELDGEVGTAHLLQLLLAAVRGDALHQGGGAVDVQDLGVPALHTAVVTDDRRLSHGDVQVAGLELDDRGQQLVDKNGGCQGFTLSGWGRASPVQAPKRSDGQAACISHYSASSGA